ncbi:MAG: hypothetical protein Q4G48_05770 [Bacteroidia bacterium]|nr:hypothetical protein [Bacteroidia bacterium]
MSKQVIILVAFATITLGAYAQKTDRAKEIAGERVEKIAEEIELSEKEKKELLEYYSKIEVERRKERAAAQKEAENRQKEREKQLNEHNKELENILGEEKFEEYKRKRIEKGGVDDIRKEKILDNFFDFIGNTAELDPNQKEKLREYWNDQERNLRKIIRVLESRQGEIKEKMDENDRRLDEIFNKKDKKSDFKESRLQL